MTEETYWASRKPEELVEAALAHVWDYYEELLTGGWFEVILRATWRYYNLEAGDYTGAGQHAGSRISFGGEQGELSYVRVNHFRSFVRHLLSLTTSNRPSFEPRPRTGSEKARQQVPAARNLLEWYFRRGRLEVTCARAVEISLIMREGYVWLDWDARAGEKVRDDIVFDGDQPAYLTDEDGERVTDESGAPIPQTIEVYQGDLVSREKTPLDVITPRCADPRNPPWRIVRGTANRWDLIASYPELAEKIRAFKPPEDDMRLDIREARPQSQETGSDEIPVWHLYHKRSSALPEGRVLSFLDSDIWFADGPLPFPTIPVVRVAPSEMIGTGRGYSDSWDLIGLAESYDAAFSALLTQVDAFAVPNVIAPEGSDVQPSDVAGGLNFWTYPPGMSPPGFMVPPPFSPAAQELMARSEEAMAKLSGVNSVVRGDPDSNIKSGAMASLIQSQAMQYNAGLQGDYFRLLEDVGTLLIQVCQQFASEERLIAIVGDDTDALASFKKDDIADIDGVTLDIGNPLARTTAGRYQLAEKLLDAKMIDPSQFMDVMRTGAVEDWFRRPRQERALIRQENELLAKAPPIVPASPMRDPRTGKPLPLAHTHEVAGVPVLATDNHPQHMSEHAVGLTRAQARNDQATQDAHLAHIYHHYSVWKATPPELRKILGIPDAPPTREEEATQAQQRPPGAGVPPVGAPPGPQGPRPQNAPPDPGQMAGAGGAAPPGVAPNSPAPSAPA